jgi:hypothetical protein
MWSQENIMNIETLSIEDLAELRDRVNARLAERVADRQRELSSEVERIGALLTQPGKPKPLKTLSAKPKYQKGDLSWSGPRYTAWLGQAASRSWRDAGGIRIAPLRALHCLGLLTRLIYPAGSCWYLPHRITRSNLCRLYVRQRHPSRVSRQVLISVAVPS